MFQDMKISFCVFSYSSQRFVPLVSFQAYTQTFEMEGAGVRFLAIPKGDTDANKMPMGDAKLRNVK